MARKPNTYAKLLKHQQKAFKRVSDKLSRNSNNNSNSSNDNGKNSDTSEKNAHDNSISVVSVKRNSDLLNNANNNSNNNAKKVKNDNAHVHSKQDEEGIIQRTYTFSFR